MKKDSFKFYDGAIRSAINREYNIMFSTGEKPVVKCFIERWILKSQCWVQICNGTYEFYEGSILKTRIRLWDKKRG